jgi:hypothetical protein
VRRATLAAWARRTSGGGLHGVASSGHRGAGEASDPF